MRTGWTFRSPEDNYSLITSSDFGRRFSDYLGDEFPWQDWTNDVDPSYYVAVAMYWKFDGNQAGAQQAETLKQDLAKVDPKLQHETHNNKETKSIYVVLTIDQALLAKLGFTSDQIRWHFDNQKILKNEFKRLKKWGRLAFQKSPHNNNLISEAQMPDIFHSMHDFHGHRTYLTTWAYLTTSGQTVFDQRCTAQHQRSSRFGASAARCIADKTRSCFRAS